MGYSMNKEREVNLPNFLIVGAARSGTTSLYHYLKQHYDIFMPSIKEPRFILAQYMKLPPKGIGDDRHKFIANYSDYCNLFKDSAGKKAIGEASIDNLYHYDLAIKYIKKFLGNPKIIIILRDPVDRALSAYKHQVRDNREYLQFEEALSQEEKRMKDGWAFIWAYKKCGFYYNPVKAYLNNFRDVKVCLLDDLKRDAVLLIKDIYKFLEVDASFTPNTKVRHNVAGSPKLRLLNNFFLNPTKLQILTKSIGKFFLGEDRWIQLREKLRAKILASPVMKHETEKYLYDLYRDDILKLQTLIGRDLSRWLESADRSRKDA